MTFQEFIYLERFDVIYGPTIPNTTLRSLYTVQGRAKKDPLTGRFTLRLNNYYGKGDPIELTEEMLDDYNLTPALERKYSTDSPLFGGHVE